MYVKFLRNIDDKLYSMANLPKFLTREYRLDSPTIIEDNLFPLYCYNSDKYIHRICVDNYEAWEVDIIKHIGDSYSMKWTELFKAKDFDSLNILSKKLLKKGALDDIHKLENVVLCDSISLIRKIKP